jgi:hypothetical protein
LIWLPTIGAESVEGNPILVNIGTLLVAFVFFSVIFAAPPDLQTDTLPLSHGAPAFTAENTRPSAPSAIEMVSGFPSFSVVSNHLVFTLLALTSLIDLKHSAWASVDPLKANKQTSILEPTKAISISTGTELRRDCASGRGAKVYEINA